MPILSTLRSKRFKARKIDNTQQMIAFMLARDWFALPILDIQKVVFLGQVSGDSSDRGIGITTYEDREVLIVDVAKQIFNQSFNSETASSLSASPVQRYLILLKDEAENTIGLPIDSQPVMHRISQADFKPLPEAYLTSGNIQCISSQIIDLKDHPIIFLLDRQQLTEYFI